jgi:hypothetical protein
LRRERRKAAIIRIVFATSVCVRDRDSIGNAVIAATALHVATPAAEIVDREEGGVIAVAVRVHQTRRTQNPALTVSPPPQRRDPLNRKYRTLQRRYRTLNRPHGVLQRHSRNLNRKCATVIAFEATLDAVHATRLPLPEMLNPSQCRGRSMSVPEKASGNQFKQRLQPLPNLEERQPSLLHPGRDALIRHRGIKS